MLALLRDVRLAVRQLARNRAFAAAAVLILGLAIGLNSTAFSVVNALLFRPLPVASAEELVAVYVSTPGAFMATSALTGTDYEDLLEQSRSLTGLFAYTYAPVVVEHGQVSRLVLGVRATPNALATLGVEPFLGRLFSPRDIAGPVAVLSHSAWERRFGADPAIVGSTIRLNGSPSTVIGIAPKEFFGLTRGVSPEVWTLLPRGAEPPRRAASVGGLWVMGRRADGVSPEQVEADLGAIASRLARDHPPTNAGRSFVALPANAVRILPQVDAKLNAGSVVILLVAGLVVLIACSNVANLLLARAIARRREIAIRRTLGAGFGAVLRQLLAESLLLALLGGGLGLALAAASNAALGSLRLPVPIDLALGLAVDHRVVLFTLGVAAATALVFGLAPALDAARADLSVGLRERGGGVGSPRAWGSVLVVVQVALSLVLLVDTGLAVRSLRNAARGDPGFDPQGVVVATFAPRLQGYSDAQAEDFFRRLTERVRTLPGVESAAVASHLPLGIEVTFDHIAPAGTTAAPESWPTVDSSWIGPGYFETMRIPILRGRAPEATDDADVPGVAVVNQTCAARLWPGVDPVGRRLRVTGVEAEYVVVGVARDGKYRTLGETPRPFLYRALAQTRGPSADTGEIAIGAQTLIVRARGSVPRALADLRRLIQEMEPRVAVFRLERLEQALGVALFLPRAAAVVFTVFGLLGLALASLGIYALMAYTVDGRTREMGIRAALGAAPRDIARLVLRRGLSLGSIGIGVGLAAAAASSRLLAAVLYGVSPIDGATFASGAALVALVTLAASYGPARRAASVDVPRALRDS